MRQRSTTRDVEESPFYRLIFATEKFIEPLTTEPLGARKEQWLEAVYACRGELALVRIHMEDAGVSTGLVFDLSVMDAALDRMELLAALLARSTDKVKAARQLLDTLFSGLLADTRVSALMRQNLNMLARKTVERTGHSGEHYIAQSKPEYWRMWRAALGGGLVTVFTAAIKLHIVAQTWPPFVEGFLVGTNYAISFLILQIFGLALATKQPSMTAATLADIIRRNRGEERRDKIADFAASISRTQLAAALGNILAVSAGAVVFNLIWEATHGTAYLPTKQAEHVYLSLRPIASGTIFFAAITGVLLWLAALIGGWCENFAIYNRIPEAIAQHPLGPRIGTERMKRLADVGRSRRGSVEQQHCAGIPDGVHAGTGTLLRHTDGCAACNVEHRHVCFLGSQLWPDGVSPVVAVLGDRGHRDHVRAEPGSELLDCIDCGAARV